MAKFADFYYERVGIRPAATPIFALLGLLAAVASAPHAFTINSGNLDRLPDWLAQPVNSIAIDVQTALSSRQVLETRNLLLPLSLVLVLALPLAAAIGSLRARSGEPLVTTIAALTLGIFSIPRLGVLASLLSCSRFGSPRQSCVSLSESSARLWRGCRFGFG